MFQRASLLLLAACATASPPVARPPVTAAGPRLEIADEAVRFVTPPENSTPVVVTADTIVAATADGAGERVVALDEGLATRWTLPIATKVRGLLALGERTLIATTIEGSEDLALQLVDRTGKVTARTTFAQLVGTACGLANRYWLAAEGERFVALVACGPQRQQWWVHVANDLSAATREPGNGWIPIHARRWLGAPMMSELAFTHLGERHVLARGLEGGGVSASTAAIGADDLIVGAWTTARQGDTSTFAGRAFVTRLGTSPWTTSLADGPTPDPRHVAAVTTLSDGRVLAAVDYGRDGRVAGLQLPAPALEHDALATAMMRGFAIVGLDGARGTIEDVLVIRPQRAWRGPFITSLGANARHVVVADAQQIVVFPRRGRPLAPAAPEPIVAPPALRAMPTVAAVTPLPERWSELCAPRRPAKPNQPCRIEHVAVGADGTVAAGGGYYGNNQLGPRALRKQAYQTGVLAVYAPGGTLRWQKIFGVSWHNDVSDILIRDDGRVVITGIHGQHFAIDDRRLPEREVRKDMDFEAVIGFVAVFDARGKLELLEDLDLLATGTRSTTTASACAGTLAPAGDVTFIRAHCPGGIVRIPLRGATPEPPVTLGLADLAIDSEWHPTPAGDALAIVAGLETTQLVRTDGRRLAARPVLASRTLDVLFASTPSATWLAGSELPKLDAPNRLVIARSDAALASASSWLVANAIGARIDALAVDEQGRPILAIRATSNLAIGGQTIEARAPDPRSPPQARAFVRLTADGTQLDRVFVPALAATECVRPDQAYITSLAAHGNTLAVTIRFGVTDACKVHDEPSTVMVFDAR